MTREWLTMSEAAELLGVSRQRVNQLARGYMKICRQGLAWVPPKLQTREVEGRWLVSAASVNARQTERIPKDL